MPELLTVGAALGQYVTAATGLYVWRSGQAESARLPYVSYLDPVADPVALAGSGRVLARRRTLQYDLWQQAIAEDDSLAAGVQAALDGALAADAQEHVWRARVIDFRRQPEETLVHHLYSVVVHHV